MSHHMWLFPDNLAQAQKAQKEMAEQVLIQDFAGKEIKTLGGFDVSNNPFDPESLIFTAAVVLSYPSLQIIETATQVQKQTFPYIPGFLGFREAPALVQTYQKLDVKPDIILVDGHGISHPRGLGIASHLGVLLDVPTIGVAKSILVGRLSEPLGEEVGSMRSLMWKGKEIGRAVRTKKRCLPLIISAGHKVNLETAIRWVLRSLKGYRLPEPTRHAHLTANACRLSFSVKVSS